MTSLPEISSSALPGTIPALRDYLLLSSEKLQAYKVVLKSLRRQGAAKDTYDRTLAEGQIMGEHVLRAEAVLGKMLEARPEVQRKDCGSRGGTSIPLPSGIDKKASHHAQQLAKHPEAIKEGIKKAKDLGEIPTRRNVLRLIRKAENKAHTQRTASRSAIVPSGKYSCIVCDPPWAMQKIEREVRPNQVGFDYPTMSEDELLAYPLVTEAADDAAHLWLWTTQRFLPLALKLVEEWGFDYLCTFVWHKPGGYQPVGLPQYNCEFVVMARRGGLAFDDTKAFPTCFQAPRREHSRKPNEFYDMLRRVSPGPRLDMFSREPREGFDQHGLELGHFAEAAE